MNAYELADWLDKEPDVYIPNRHNEVLTMLRQQADRIAELEKNLDIAIMVTKKDANRIAELEKESKKLKLQNEKMQSVIQVFNFEKAIRLGRIG